MEILRLLAEDTDRDWTASEVFKTIQSSRTSVTGNLEYFARERILRANPDGTYRFVPESAEIHRLAAELLQAYRERRVAVIEAIYQAPLAPIRDFAEAFRLRKDNP